VSAAAASSAASRGCAVGMSSLPARYL